MSNESKVAWELLKKLLSSPIVRTLFIYGPPGVGKTFAAFFLGRIEAGYYSVTLTEDTSAAEVRGHFIFKGGDAVWHDGPFLRAMREGKRLVINEIKHANADVLALLFPVLESWETAELTLPTGETVRPAPGFHVVVTDNDPPDQLPAPLQDRFMAIVHLTEPHPDAFADLRDGFRQLAEAGLAISDDRRISARRWQYLQMLENVLGLEHACLAAFGLQRGRMAYDAIRLALAAKGGKRASLS